MGRALEWAMQGSFPLLEFLTPFTSCCGALLDGAVVEAADLAEEFWAEAWAVPVWRLFALPVVNAALIDAGRIDDAGANTELAAGLVSEMEAAPLSMMSLQLARSQVALARDELEAAACAADAALDGARAYQLPLVAVDAIELRAAVSERRAEHEVSRSLGEGAQVERHRLGYRFAMTPKRV
jgi:hypothetical protein